MNLEAAVCMLLFFPLSRKQKARMNVEAAVCLWLIFFFRAIGRSNPVTKSSSCSSLGKLWIGHAVTNLANSPAWAAVC